MNDMVFLKEITFLTVRTAGDEGPLAAGTKSGPTVVDSVENHEIIF
jgi:hypothetical protein